MWGRGGEGLYIQKNTQLYVLDNKTDLKEWKQFGKARLSYLGLMLQEHISPWSEEIQETFSKVKSCVIIHVWIMIEA